MAGLTTIAITRRFAMTENNHMSRAEIAEALGVTEDVVKSLLYRAMKKIRKQYPELRQWIEDAS